jgi:hypothetical protein
VGRRTGLLAYFTHCPEVAYTKGNRDNAGMRIMRSSVDAAFEVKLKHALNKENRV